MTFLHDFKKGQKKFKRDDFQKLGRAAKQILNMSVGRGLNRIETRFGSAIWPTRQKKQEAPAAASGAVQQFRIIDANFANTILAEPWDGTAAMGEAVHVARPPLLRIGELTAAGYTLNGASFSVSPGSSFAAGLIVATQVSLPTYTESWTLSPSYFRFSGEPSAIIYAASTDHTGVFVGGEPVVWIDLNLDSRRWMFTLPGAAALTRSKFFMAVGRVG